MQQKIAMLSLLFAFSGCQERVERKPKEGGFYISTETVLFSYYANAHKCLLYEFADEESSSADITIIDNGCDGSVDKIFDILEGNKITTVRGNKDLEEKLNQRLKNFYAEHKVMERIRNKDY